MCLPTPAACWYRVMVVPRCSPHLAPALNMCSALCPSAVLLRAAISRFSSGQLWLSPRCEAACRRCESLLLRRCSLRPSLSRAASRLARLMISGRSRELAALCAGSLKGNVGVVGGAGGGDPTWFPFLPGVSCAKPIARCGPGEVGLSGEWRLAVGLRARLCAREGVGVGDGLLGPLRGPHSFTTLGVVGRLVEPAVRLRVGVGVWVGVGVSCESTTFCLCLRFLRSVGVCSMVLAAPTGGACGVLRCGEGLLLARGCLGGGVARGRERGSWAALSAEARASWDGLFMLAGLRPIWVGSSPPSGLWSVASGPLWVASSVPAGSGCAVALPLFVALWLCPTWVGSPPSWGLWVLTSGPLCVDSSISGGSGCAVALPLCGCRRGCRLVVGVNSQRSDLGISTPAFRRARCAAGWMASIVLSAESRPPAAPLTSFATSSSWPLFVEARRRRLVWAK